MENPKIYRHTVQADIVLGHIFSDVYGHMTKFFEVYEYFVTWINDKSGKVFVNGIKAKSKVGKHLKTF